MAFRHRPALLACLLLPPATLLPAQDQAIDQEYTQALRDATTNECFLTPYVDHLPASDTVPSPLEFLGHIAGAPDVLSYSQEVHDYMRAVASASPRVAVFPAGLSEEGREMILVAVADEDTLARLQEYKDISARLADPRGLSDQEGAALVAAGKPIYWATGAIHSPETGSPEMLMELVYRLAVEDTPFVRAIREGLIFLTTPILEPDGRDKRVDLQKLRLAEQVVPRLLYWGKYVAHDNNRDGLLLGLELSQSIRRTSVEYHPQVMHDLHESASHLYTSTGSGPYNAWLDPIVVDEWHVLAYQEVSEMTRLGVPGVWTHDFYDGWAPNYAFYAANGHNAIGRFYETQGAGDADTRRITTRSTRTWFRPNPPLPETLWSIRNNVNMQQSALLIALNHVATHGQEFLANFLLKGRRSVDKPWQEGPAAYVFPADDPRKGQQADLLAALQEQGVEVHRLVREATVGEAVHAAGSFVVRMDQPYSRMADMMLDQAYYNAEDNRPYDDTGWTLGPLFHAQVVREEDATFLDAYMEPVEGPVLPPGGVQALTAGDPAGWLVPYHADVRFTTFRFACAEVAFEAFEEDFPLAGESFRAGTLWVPRDGNDAEVAAVLDAAGQEHGVLVYATEVTPEAPRHPLTVPRIALVHTWTTTQNEGWVRMALDRSGVPYEYISVHELRDTEDLKAHYDVLLMGPSSGDALSIVRGLPRTGEPIPWKASETAPNIGRQDATDDMRGGLEFEGVAHLRDFIRAGGVLLAIQNSTSLPIHFGLSEGVREVETEDLQVSGSVLQARFVDATSPIRYGYGDELGVYFRRTPVLGTGGGGGRFRGFGGAGGANGAERILTGTARPTGRGGIDEQDRVQGRSPDLGRPEQETDNERRGGRTGGRAGGEGSRAASRGPRVILRFHPQHEELLISGMLAGGDELAGTPTVIDTPLGEGHVVLFGINPMWRLETHGSYPLVFNAMLHFDHLDAGRGGGPSDG